MSSYYATSDLFNTTSLPATNRPNLTMMSELERLWYQMFLSTLVSSVILHSIGSFVFFVRLRKYKYSIWLAGGIFIVGVVTPTVLGSINNILIASILVFSGRFDLPFYVIVLIGLGQTLIVIGIGFLKILQTL